MSQTRRKRKERGAADAMAAVQSGLNLPEVVEALAGEALAAEREQQLAAKQQAEQEALIAATQESETRPDTAFQLKRVVESLLFASDRPLTVANLRQLVGSEVGRKEVQESLDALVEEYSERGIVLHDVAGGYQFRTHPASSEWIQKLIAGRPVRLSRAQLDTLAIVAYRQPITRPEIDDIRGVDSASTVKVLLDRNMVRILGKKEEVGRPLLYGTSKEFLEFFNLAELRDLPTLREFHELNDEGMAQVDKLGADIRGVDVGAVAAQVAQERVAEAKAAEERAEAEAEARRIAKEEAKAEALAAKQQEADLEGGLASVLGVPAAVEAEVEAEPVEAVDADAVAEPEVEAGPEVQAEAAAADMEPVVDVMPAITTEAAVESLADDIGEADMAWDPDSAAEAELSADESVESETTEEIDDESAPDLTSESEHSFVESSVSASGDPVVEDGVMAIEGNEGYDPEDSADDATLVERAPVDPDTDMQAVAASEFAEFDSDDPNVENTVPDLAIPQPPASPFLEPISTIVDPPPSPDVTLVDREPAPDYEAAAEVEPTDVGGFDGEDTSISSDPAPSTDEAPPDEETP